jgi:hypothetical protein
VSSRTKNETFDFFEMLLRIFEEGIIRHSSLSKSLTYFAERFNFLKQAFDLEDNLSFSQEMRQNIKTEFFRRYGGNTIANKNIYDLVIYKKQKQNQRIQEAAQRAAQEAQRAAQEAQRAAQKAELQAKAEKQKTYDDLFGSFGGGISKKHNKIKNRSKKRQRKSRRSGRRRNTKKKYKNNKKLHHHLN